MNKMNKIFEIEKKLFLFSQSILQLITLTVVMSCTSCAWVRVAREFIFAYCARDLRHNATRLSIYFTYRLPGRHSQKLERVIFRDCDYVSYVVIAYYRDSCRHEYISIVRKRRGCSKLSTMRLLLLEIEIQWT